MDIRIILFLHLAGSIAMGYYLLLPFLLRRLGSFSGETQAGYIGGLYKINRISQYLLVLQFITGGYLLSKGDYSPVWTSAVLFLFLLVSAMAGMMGRPMKRLQQRHTDGKGEGSDISKVRIYGTLAGISYFILVVLMAFPES